MKNPTGKPSARATATAHVLAAAVAVTTIAAPAHLLAQEGGHMMHGDHHDGVTVLRAARMLDVVTGEMHTGAVLVVEDGIITAVNPETVPHAMHDMDLGDVTLLPGFIDAHTHLASQISATSFTDAVMRTEAYYAINAVRFGGLTVRAGFTTVRDFGGDVTVELGHAVERGDILGPRVIPSRSPLGITGGHCDVTGFAPGIREGGPEEGVADGPWEVVEAVRYQIKHGAKVIKTCATAGVLSMEGPVGAQQYTLEELTAMVDEAARHGGQGRRPRARLRGDPGGGAGGGGVDRARFGAHRRDHGPHDREGDLPRPNHLSRRPDRPGRAAAAGAREGRGDPAGHAGEPGAGD